MRLASRALVWSTAIGTVLQIAMVTVGHNNGPVKALFAPLGMGLSFVAGILYTVMSTEVVTRDTIVGGAIAGGLSAFIGIVISVVLGDVTPWILVVGTASSAVSGAVGGWLGRLFASGRV